MYIITRFSLRLGLQLGASSLIQTQLQITAKIIGDGRSGEVGSTFFGAVAGEQDTGGRCRPGAIAWFVKWAGRVREKHHQLCGAPVLFSFFGLGQSSRLGTVAAPSVGRGGSAMSR